MSSWRDVAETVGSIEPRTALYAVRTVDVWQHATAQQLGLDSRILDFLVLKGALLRSGDSNVYYELSERGRRAIQQHGAFSNRDAMRRMIANRREGGKDAWG